MADEQKKRINVYLTGDEKKQFEDVAAANQRSVSSMARSLMVNAIKQAQTAMPSDHSSEN